jgi:phosphatidylserine/phosphatidylglycerophosphate/cardiolipin synthase-like enzyme
VHRGVFVHALIADTNRSGERNLRKLEMRLLAKGMTVARTSNDLVRYHGKMMIIDRRELFVLAFNFTRLDIDHSRSFGIVTRNRQLVQEAIKLFESDTKRQPYTPRHNKFLVSPLNAREELSKFLKGAKQELLIYDSKVSDMAMIRILEQRTKGGVSIKIIGHVPSRNRALPAGKLPRIRLHTRTIVRDRKQVFIGSQSLRELELDARREVGVILRDSKVVTAIARTFETDWSAIETSAGVPSKQDPTAVVAKAAAKAAEAITRDLPSVGPMVEKVVQQVVGDDRNLELDHAELEANVRDAVEHAVRTTVKEMVEEVAEQNEPA